MAPPPLPTDDLAIKLYGRTFCSFGLRNGISCVPVDEEEDDRFSIHQPLLAGPDLVYPEFPPSGVASPSVLDLGFGTATWISEFLNIPEHRGYSVTGIDIFNRNDARSEQLGSDDDNEEEDHVDVGELECSDFDKIRWNLNARFPDMPQQDRLNQEVFHLINSQFLADGINKDRWAPLVKELLRLLVPGGWLQMVEVDWVFHSSNFGLPCLTTWWYHYELAQLQMGKDPLVGERLMRLMGDAGFQGIIYRPREVPAAGWKDGWKKQGTDNLEALIEMLRTYSLVPFKRIRRMSDETYERIVGDAQKELSERGESAKIYIKVSVSPEPSKVRFADCGPGMWYTDKGRYRRFNR